MLAVVPGDLLSPRRRQRDLTEHYADASEVTGLPARQQRHSHRVRYQGPDGPGELRQQMTGHWPVTAAPRPIHPARPGWSRGHGAVRRRLVPVRNHQPIKTCHRIISDKRALILIPREGYFQAGAFL